MHYKLLGKSGLRVSEICLGTMTFGPEWGYGADKEESRRIFNTFLDAGGNFIDTANRYTEGTSETWLGEFVNESGRRDELVVATKYSLVSKFNRINDGGNHRKNLIQSVEGSLRRLDLEYIDLLWLHAWDFTTPEEEVMRALDDLVRAGKVLYIGISDTPAWLVSRMNTIAGFRGWTPFIGLQVEYSLIQREPERDLLPMAHHLDIGVTAWAPLGGGALTGKYLGKNDSAKRLKEGSKRLNERSMAIAQKVAEIAKAAGCTPGQVALRWVMEQHPQMFPIVGCRNAAQLTDSIGCVEAKISAEQFQQLNEVSAIELGFPHDFLKSDSVQQVTFGGLQGKIINHRK
ncbi:MAG: putative oxidoreductase, aryl-alcohol dehydrogenase like protein [Bacteroidetes bacterium]|nr:MAG: putative oxidoreductase, aryl-alcohol dehydrogenase like protein [Bacteroidota bacterium]